MFNAGKGRMYLQSDGYNPESSEKIITAYGKEKTADEMNIRVSDIANG